MSKASAATFGGVSAKILPSADDTSISVTTPAHSPGKVDVVIESSAGQKLTLTNGESTIRRADLELFFERKGVPYFSSIQRSTRM